MMKMTAGIELKPEEKYLFDSINQSINILRNYYSAIAATKSQDAEEKITEEEIRKLRVDMALNAHVLHMKLKERGIEPKHHKYMLKNRRVPAEDLEFYNHIHPIEDLIAFIHNPDANNDPEDSTMGESFQFSIFTRRWGHYDHYWLIRTEKGWKITGDFPNSQEDLNSDKKGYPHVYDVLDHDFVNYPHHIGMYLEAVWNSAAEGADWEEVQQALNNIAEWISFCEKSSPRSGILGDGI
jgi:hypothetical protein